MDIKYLFKVAKRNFHWFLIVPIIMVVLTFLIVRDSNDTFKSNSLIYTGVATGYNINVESQDQLRTDYMAVTVTFDNLINIIDSRQVKEEVGIRMLAEDILSDNVDINGMDDFDSTDVNNLIEQLNYREELLKGEIPILNFYDIDQKDENIAKIYRLLHSDPSNKLLEGLILNSESSKYSVKTISNNLTASRKGSSDMIELAYTAINPLTAQKTLVLILDVFSNKQNQIKETEALNVIKYFKSKLDEVENTLKVSEENLKRFKEQNGVINFQSQTDGITRQKEVIQSEYDRELMTLRGAQKAKARLETELKNKNNLPQFNKSMIRLRNQLASLNDRKVRAELANRNDSIRLLNNRIRRVEAELQTTLSQNYASGVTVSSQELLTSWLAKVIEESESEARLKVFQQRLAQTAREYDTYAPLGSRLEQYQRQRNIHEKEYLQILNDLNQAKIRQNNIATANLVDIVDYPSKPIQAEPDKKILYVLIAGILGFITIAAIIFVKVFFDNTIRTPQRAEKMLQLEVIGVLPKIMKKKKKYYDQLINQIISKIKILDSGEELNVMVFSIQPREGKTVLIEEITNRLSDDEKRRIKFYEHPALVHGELHHKIIQKTKAQIIIVDANRELEEADYYQLERLAKVTDNQFVVLNKVKSYILDSILGKFINI